MISQAQLDGLFQAIGFRCSAAVTLLKTANDVYRLVCDNRLFFLKLYTKSWYGSDVLATGYCVDHEVAAWNVLAAHGLAVPQVVLAAQHCHNPLNRPFLLTKALRGQSLTEALRQADSQQFTQQLYAVGRYLGQMHAITLAYPGYISSYGPYEPPQPDEWQHWIWTFDRFEQYAHQTWQADAANVPAESLQEVESYWRTYHTTLADMYRPPRFIHGDCHAHQFFVYQEGGTWHVSGVVDMESIGALPLAGS